MTLGRTPTQPNLWHSTVLYCQGRLAPDSIYAVLHRECFNLFPDEMFADLYTGAGRRSVPPMVVAVVMVLQRLEGLSDREAVERFAFDARWKYAAGGLDFDYPGFSHTVLVDTRARLARSARPGRIFEVTLDVAKKSGLVGAKRVVDSTPIYDAVATMDTVTLVRSAIRGLLREAGPDLEADLRGRLSRDDDYVAAGKPDCAWDDRGAREALVDALARDAMALLGALEDRAVSLEAAEAAALLATVVGQDLDAGADGVFRIARRVAKDRVISTVDPQARHGHKTSARGFDGYKGHIAADPDSEIITATHVSAGNTGDAEAAEQVLADTLPLAPANADADAPAPANAPANADAPAPADARGDAGDGDCLNAARGGGDRPAVYGDAAYGTGDMLAKMEAAGVDPMTKVQPPTAAGGRFAKDSFAIDLRADTVTCPAGLTAPIRRASAGGGSAAFGAACATCPLTAQCTTSAAGRTITIHPREAELARARARQADPAWQADYKATRPKVERKIAHLTRRSRGGGRARMRGRDKIAADFSLLAAAANLARLAALGLARTAGGWAVNPT
jgi:Transposase DDE domain/Transposase domain (DUF772)